MDATARCPDCSLEGGWNDFAFAVRAAFGSLGTAVVEVMPEESVSRRLPLFSEGEQAFCDDTLSAASLDVSCRLSKLLVGMIPGPTLFRGARAAACGGAWAGNWLCRRVRMAMLEGGGGIDEPSVAKVLLLPETVAPMDLRLFDWLKRRAKELLRAGRVSVGALGKGAMLGVLLLAGRRLL